MQKIKIIAAIDGNNGIGYKNNLLFRDSDDLKHFKKLTDGQIVVMGRKTFESIGKALPNRTNIVITSDKSYAPQNVAVASSIPEVFEFCKFNTALDVYIIGGQTLYEKFIDKADTIILTKFNNIAENVDTYFPKINEKLYTLKSKLYLKVNVVVNTYIKNDRKTV